MNQNKHASKKNAFIQPTCPGEPLAKIQFVVFDPSARYPVQNIVYIHFNFNLLKQMINAWEQLSTFTFPPKLSRSLVGTSHWSPWRHLFDHSEETPWKDVIKLPIGSTHGMFAYIHFSFRSIKVCDLCRHATLSAFTKKNPTFHVGKYTINGFVMGVFQRLKTSDGNGPRLSACSSWRWSGIAPPNAKAQV